MGKCHFAPLESISRYNAREISFRGTEVVSYSTISYDLPQFSELVQGAAFGDSFHGIEDLFLSSCIAAFKDSNSPCGSACRSSSMRNICRWLGLVDDFRNIDLKVKVLDCQKLLQFWQSIPSTN